MGRRNRFFLFVFSVTFAWQDLLRPPLYLNFIYFESTAYSDNTNVFVEKCLAMVLSYTKESLGYGVLSDVIASVSSEGKVLHEKHLLNSSLLC